MHSQPRSPPRHKTITARRPGGLLAPGLHLVRLANP